MFDSNELAKSYRLFLAIFAVMVICLWELAKVLLRHLHFSWSG